MSCIVSESASPESSVHLHWVDCPHCPQRDRSYAGDYALHSAAYQGRSAAKFLAKKADRLTESVARASDVRSLLDADESMIRALSCALNQEMAMIKDLSLKITR